MYKMYSINEVCEYLNHLFVMILNWKKIQDGNSKITLQYNKTSGVQMRFSPLEGLGGGYCLMSPK